VQLEADIAEVGLESEAAGGQHHRAGHGAPAGEDVRQLTPDHQADHPFAGEVAGTLGANVPAIAQHAHLVRDLEQLLHPVGDVEDPLAL